MKNQLGLIGKTLKHSFSKAYFEKKFSENGLSEEWAYDLYELAEIEEIEELWQSNLNLRGLNVTIPYKQEVIPYLDSLSREANEIGAVNTIKIKDGQKKGYNTDVIGFRDSLLDFLDGDTDLSALVLGTGGASLGIKYVLDDLEIKYAVVSRNKDKGDLTYTNLDSHTIEDHRLIINCTPAGTYPKIYDCPDIPYEFLTKRHYLYDLVYNPEVTEFMKRGEQNYAAATNGYAMLVGQAEAAWEIWTEGE